METDIQALCLLVFPHTPAVTRTHMSTHTQLTSAEQQFHHREVGVGDGVVKRCIPVAICHVDHKLQQLRGDWGEGVHISLDNSRVGCFVTGHTQPLLQHGGVGCPLRSDTMRTLKRHIHTWQTVGEMQGHNSQAYRPTMICISKSKMRKLWRKKKRKYVDISSSTCKNAEINVGLESSF